MQHEDKINLQFKSKAVKCVFKYCEMWYLDRDRNATLKQKVEIRIIYEKKSRLWWRLKAAAGHLCNAGNPKLCDTLKLLESSPDKRESRTSKVKSRTRGCKAHETATSNTQQ